MIKPELVMPAGDLEKLITAILFGADAVYLGGKEFSLRAYAGNFTREEMVQGLEFAHQKKKKVYVTVNALAHNRDIENLPPYLQWLADLKVDGLIISDPGVLKLALEHARGIPITISTQSNISNYASAHFYREMGASRIVPARELTLQEIAEIRNKVDVELEVFIHGAMCVSYSGRCLLSHYMAGRSANQGMCAHPCRYRYRLVEEKRPGQYFPIDEDEKGSYILNSRDLCLLEHIPRLIETGVHAFKVEGRMKSPLYVASVCRVYRRAIDKYMQVPQPFLAEEMREWLKELYSTATRPFTTGFINGEDSEIQDIFKETRWDRDDFIGIVKAYHMDKKMIEVEQRANFGRGEELELLIPGGDILKISLNTLYDKDFSIIDRARHPRERVYLPCEKVIPEYTILRRVSAENQSGDLSSNTRGKH